jgi:predicted MFS family arabinose efflux permease
LTTKPHRSSEKSILAVILLARTNVNLALRITYPFLPAISRGLGVSLGAASALVSVRSLLTGVGAPLFGALADRLGGRRVMLWGIVFLVGGAAITAGLPWYAGALLGFGLAGLAKGAYDPALQVYVGQRVPYAQRGRALGITELAWSAAWLGMPLSGWLMARAGWRAPFAVIAALGLAGLGLTWRVLPPDPGENPATAPQPQAWAALRQGFGQLRGDRHAWLALGITALLISSVEILTIVYGAWMEHTFGLEVTALGLVSLLLGVAEAVAELGAALLSDRLGKRRAVSMGVAVMSAGYLLLPRLTGNLAVALAGTVLVVLAFEFSIVSFIPLVSGMSATARGTLMSLNVVAFSVGRMVAAPLAVALYRPTDLSRNGLLSATLALLSLGLLSLLRERGH